MNKDYIYYYWKPYSGTGAIKLFKIYNGEGRLSEKYVAGQGWVAENTVNDLFFKGELSSIHDEEQVAEIINSLENM